MSARYLGNVSLVLALLVLGCYVIDAQTPGPTIPINQFVNSTITLGAHNYYQFQNVWSAVDITLITTSGDSDLYVSTVDPNPNERTRSSVVYSRSVNPSDNVLITTPGSIYIGVYGYQPSTYSLIVRSYTDTAPLPNQSGFIRIVSSGNEVRLSWGENLRSTNTSYAVFMLPYSSSMDYLRMVLVDDILTSSLMEGPWTTSTQATITNLPSTDVGTPANFIVNVIARNQYDELSSYSFRLIVPGSLSGILDELPWVSSLLESLWIVMGLAVFLAAVLIILSFYCIQRMRARRRAQTGGLDFGGGDHFAGDTADVVVTGKMLYLPGDVKPVFLVELSTLMVPEVTCQVDDTPFASTAAAAATAVDSSTETRRVPTQPIALQPIHTASRASPLSLESSDSALSPDAFDRSPSLVRLLAIRSATDHSESSTAQGVAEAAMFPFFGPSSLQR